MPHSKVQRVRLAIPVNIFATNKTDVEPGKGKLAKVEAVIKPPFVSFTHGDKPGEEILVPLNHVKSILTVVEPEPVPVEANPRQAEPAVKRVAKKRPAAKKGRR